MNHVSVIIPVYNAEKYLRECLDSVINQTLKNIEIICINDISTDDSLAILKEYTSRDDRIIILTNETKKYAGGSRNRGIELAKGEYIHFLDADDYLALDAYETLYHKAKEHNLDVLKFKTTTFDSRTGRRLPSAWCQLSELSPQDYDTFININVASEKCLNAPDTPWSGIYRRSFLSQNDLLFYDLPHREDHSFYISVILKAKKVMFIDYNAMYYRINVSTSETTKYSSNFDCLLRSFHVVNKLCEALDYDLRNRILCKEINYILSELIRYRDKHALSSEIYEQAKDFFRNLDVSAFEKNRGFCYWCKRYVLRNSFNSFTINGRYGFDQAIKQAYRFAAICRNEGLGYALRKTKTILSRKEV